MRKQIISIEEFEDVAVVDTEVSFDDTSAQDSFDSIENVVSLDEGITDAVNVSATLGDISGDLEQSAEKGEYLTAVGAAGLNTAIEHMLSSIGMKGNIRVVAALEDFSSELSVPTANSSSSNSEATEKTVAGIKATLLKIWEKIKAAFKKLWEWIKEFFNNSAKAVANVANKFAAVLKRGKDAVADTVLGNIDLPPHLKGMLYVRGAGDVINSDQIVLPWAKQLEETRGMFEDSLGIFISDMRDLGWTVTENKDHFKKCVSNMKKELYRTFSEKNPMYEQVKVTEKGDKKTMEFMLKTGLRSVYLESNSITDEFGLDLRESSDLRGVGIDKVKFRRFSFTSVVEYTKATDFLQIKNIVIDSKVRDLQKRLESFNHIVDKAIQVNPNKDEIGEQMRQANQVRTLVTTVLTHYSKMTAHFIHTGNAIVTYGNMSFGVNPKATA